MKVSNETLFYVDIVTYVIYVKGQEVPTIGGLFGQDMPDDDIIKLAKQIEGLTDDEIDEVVICRK